MIYRITSVCIFILFFLMIIPVVYAYDLGDRRQKIKQGILPSFCLCCGHINNPCGPEIKKYYHYYGPIYNHIHHFCWGMDKKYKAFIEITKEGKEKRLKDALGEFNYVIKRGSQDTKKKLIPVVFIERAKTLILLGDKRAALKDFKMAIKFNPKYLGGYVALANFYMQNGSPDKACSVVKTGMKKNPGNDKLRAFQKKICGQ